MSWLNDKVTAMPQGARLAAGAALIAIGVAGGAGAASLGGSRIEMAPAVVTPIAKLGANLGIVTIKGRVAEVYGDRVLIIDDSGKAMVDIGRGRAPSLAVGSTVWVQGRFDDGQFHASFIVKPGGSVEAIGRGPHGPHGGPDRRGEPMRGPGPDGAVAPVDCPTPPTARP